MAKRIETDDDGYIHISPDALGDKRPHAQYEIEREGNDIHLRFAQDHKQTRSKEEAEAWVREFRQWMRELAPRAPILPDEALRSESFYD